MEEILNILDKEKGNVSRAKIAQMLGMEEKEVADKIEKMEKENVIVGYKTIVNWDKTDKDVVVALIELRITPQRGEGFDKVAERIYKYPQVKSLYLMSGAYDNRGQEYERSGIVRCAEACTDGFDNFNGNSFCAKKIQRGRNCIRGR